MGSMQWQLGLCGSSGRDRVVCMQCIMCVSLGLWLSPVWGASHGCRQDCTIAYTHTHTVCKVQNAWELSVHGTSTWHVCRLKGPLTFVLRIDNMCREACRLCRQK